MHLKKKNYVWICLMLLPVLVVAQERTAGGPLRDQMSWAALNSQIEALRNYAQGVNARVDQIELCGQAGKVYAPGHDEADANGCRDAAVDLTMLDRMLECSKLGKFFNGTTCVGASAVSAASYTKIVMAQGGTGGGTSTAIATCPAGYVRTGCSGARNATMTDTCEEDKCGLVGAGPVGEAACKATVDGDSGTRATVWATCVKIDVSN